SSPSVSVYRFRLSFRLFVSSSPSLPLFAPLFFFTAPASTEIYTLSLHDALPISHLLPQPRPQGRGDRSDQVVLVVPQPVRLDHRSEEHTSELQSPDHLVCRLLLEKKKKKKKKKIINKTTYLINRSRAQRTTTRTR